MAQNISSEEIQRLERLANSLDSKFRVPFTNIRFGYDSLLGLIPGVGDIATLAPSCYLIWIGKQAGVGFITLAKMTGNAGLDFVIGSVPIIGDIFDIGFKANRRNVALLRRALEDQAETTAGRNSGR